MCYCSVFVMYFCKSDISIISTITHNKHYNSYAQSFLLQHGFNSYSFLICTKELQVS